MPAVPQCHYHAGRRPLNRRSVLAAILTAAPALLLAWCIAHYGVDVPYWDQWAPAGLVASARNGTLTLENLWAQQNDSRLFFPRLLFITIDVLGHGNVKYEMFAMLLVAALVLWNIHGLATRTVPSQPARLTATILANCLIFSPIQWQNWLWGIQLIMFLPVACLTCAVRVCYTRWNPWIRLCVAAALAVVATYSYANGMVCWMALVVLVAIQFPNRASKLAAMLVWSAIAGLSIAAFFHGYLPQAGTGKLTDPLEIPAKAIQCLLAFLGAPLASARVLEDRWIAIAAGAACLLLMLGAVLRLFRQPEMLRRSAGWLTIAAYSFGSALVTTAARARGSPIFLLDSRYTTFSLYFIVPLLFVLAILHGKTVPRPAVRAASALGIAVLVALHARNSWYALDHMRRLRTERLQAKACLAFVNVVDSSCQAAQLDWNVAELKQVANALDHFGYLHPALVKSADPRVLAAPADSSYGAFEALKNAGNGMDRAYGRAVLPARGGEPADAVLLSYLKPGGEPAVFSIADRVAHVPSAWEQWIELPQGANMVQAWAYDALSGRTYLLSPQHSASDAPAESIRFEAGNGGSFDGVIPAAPPVAAGWAVLWQKHRPADRVLLTCGDGAALLATVAPWVPRPDVVAAFQNARLEGAGWSVPLPWSRIPAAGCEVKAWAWDRQSGEATQLTGVHRVEGNGHH